MTAPLLCHLPGLWKLQENMNSVSQDEQKTFSYMINNELSKSEKYSVSFFFFPFRRQCLQPPLHTLLHSPPLRLAALSTQPGDLCASWPSGRPRLHPFPANRLQQCDGGGSIFGRPSHIAGRHE